MLVNSCNTTATSSVENYNGPFLLLHSPAQAGYFMSSSRPKTFIYKQPISPDAKQEIPVQSKDCSVPNIKENTSQCLPLTAVTFSESMEVFNRLADSFWPGPVKIFAPVRMRTPKILDTKIETRSTSEKPMALNSDCVPSPSSIRPISQDSSVIPKDLEKRGNLYTPDAVPIFPTSVLATQSSLLVTQSEKKGSYFVGFRCPSHPLANRILTEAYISRTMKGKRGHEMKNDVRRLQGAIFGSSSCSRHHAYRQPRTAMDVCTNLLLNQQHKSEQEVKKKTVYVLNGEDKREIFHVPACQFSSTESVSLVINCVNRTVSIIRDGPSHKGVNHGGETLRDSSVGITVENVQQALHVCKTGEDKKLKSKIVASVMRRWTVHEGLSC